jgi:type II secretion system protein G
MKDKIVEEIMNKSKINRETIKFDAFTLLELLIVLTIIGILMAVGMAGIPKLIETANKKAVETEMASFRVAIMNYKVDNGSTPTSVDELLSRGYITQELAIDPWGDKYMLRIKEGTGILEVVSAGADKKFGTEDDITKEAQI